jgi:hypothetical protein
MKERISTVFVLKDLAQVGVNTPTAKQKVLKEDIL